MRRSMTRLAIALVSIPLGHTGGRSTPEPSGIAGKANSPGYARAPHKNPDQDQETGNEQDGGMSTGLTVGLSVVVVVVLIAVAALVFTLCRRKRSKAGSEALRRTLRDPTNTLSLAKLKMNTAEVIGSADAAEQIVSMVADEENEKRDIECGKIKEMETPVRYQFIKLRTETAVAVSKKGSKGKTQKGQRNTNLHMSKMRDYNGHTALLCQAPFPDQFADQWRAIWHEKVGLVVWIGTLEENGQKKIEPYIPLTERQKLTVGNFVIQTVAAVQRPHEYDQYLVRVYKTRPNGKPRTRSRELIFVHAHFWPDHSAPMVPAKLADFVERLHDHHKECIRRGLIGALFHCSAGVQRSPALLAVYIGRQVWERDHKVNLLGILRYIRRNRYKAFGLGNAALQVQIVYGVMQILAMRMEFQAKTGVKGRKRHLDVFDERMRTTSLQAKAASGSGSGSSTGSYS